MKNKISTMVALVLCMIISLSTVLVSAESDVMLFAEDGRSKYFPASQVSAQLNVGWYTEPVQRLYAEGKSKVFKQSEVVAQLNVGWYTEPVQRLYAEGKSKLFPKSQVTAQLNVGWYTEPVQRLYAPGKSKLFKKSEVAAQLTVGWSTTPVANNAVKPVVNQQPTTTPPSGYTKMYALDGRSKYVINSQVAANESVGWYTEADYNLIRQGYRKLAVPITDLTSLNSQDMATGKPVKGIMLDKTNIGTKVPRPYITGLNEGYIEYYLGGQYTELTGVFFLKDHHGVVETQAYYEVIADGKSIYKTPIFNTNSIPLNFKVNIKGCNVLKIVCHVIGSYSNENYKLGDVKLCKWIK